MRRASSKTKFEQQRCTTIIPHERETQRTTTAPRICRVKLYQRLVSIVFPRDKEEDPARVDERERHKPKKPLEKDRDILPEGPAKSTPPPRSPAVSRRTRIHIITLVCFNSNFLSNFCHVIRKSAHISSRVYPEVKMVVRVDDDEKDTIA